MNDFVTFYEIGVYAANGKDIYQAATSTGMVVYYLPIFSLVMSLFSLLPLQLAAGLWMFGKVIAGGFLLHRVTRVSVESFDQLLSNRTYKSFHISIAILGIGASLTADLVLGQFNTYLAAGFLAIWLLSQSSTQKSEHLAAVIFAIISSKLTPFVLLPVVILKRRWSLAFWMVIYSVGSNLLAAGVLGLPLLDLLAALNTTATEHKFSIIELTNIKNQSLIAMLGRFYLDFPEYSLAQYFVIVVGVFVFAITGVLLLNYLLTNRRSSSELSLRDISIAILISLILSPDTRTAHLVQLIVPVLLLSGWLSTLLAKILLSWVIVFVGVAGTTLIGETGLQIIRSHSLQGITLLFFLIVILLAPRVGEGWKCRSKSIKTLLIGYFKGDDHAIRG